MKERKKYSHKGEQKGNTGDLAFAFVTFEEGMRF